MSQDVQFLDIYQTKVQVGFSRSGYIRIDMSGENIPTKIHEPTGDAVTPCISMTVNQAQILKSALEELIGKSDD